MPEKFDAYYKWFGIRPEDQPPDCYRLLGIQRFETDLDVISNAADQRMNHLRTLQNGPHALESQKILNHVSKARVTLLDTERKLAYDVSLRKKIAAAAAVAATASVGAETGTGYESLSDLTDGQIAADAFDDVDLKETVSQASPAMRPATMSSSPRGRAKGKSTGYKLASIAIGGVLGLVIAYLLLGNLVGFDPLGFFPPKVILGQTDGEKSPKTASIVPGDDNPNDSPKKPSLDGGNPPAESPSRTDKPRPGNGSVSPNPQKKPPGDKTTPRAPAVGEMQPKPMPMVPEVVDLFGDLPRQVALPPVAETAPRELLAFSAPGPVRIDEVSLLTTAVALEATQKFELIAEHSGPATRWRVILSNSADAAGNAATPVLADLWLDRAVLRFQWQAAAASEAAAAQLQNCVLRLVAGDQSTHITLRTPRVQPAHVLDLSIAANLIDLNLEAPPKAEVLMLEIGPRDVLPSIADFRDERMRVPFQTGTKEKITITLGAVNAADQPELPVQPQVLRTGLHLRIAPQIVKTKGSYSLSMPQVADIKKKYSVQKIKVDKRWGDLRDRSAMLQEQFKNIDKVFVTTPAQRVARERERNRIGTLLRAVEIEFKEATADKAEVDGVLDSLPAVEELIAQLHKKAKIPYRVFAQVGESEINLIQATE